LACLKEAKEARSNQVQNDKPTTPNHKVSVKTGRFDAEGKREKGTTVDEPAGA